MLAPVHPPSVNNNSSTEVAPPAQGADAARAHPGRATADGAPPASAPHRPLRGPDHDPFARHKEVEKAAARSNRLPTVFRDDFLSELVAGGHRQPPLRVPFAPQLRHGKGRDAVQASELTKSLEVTNRNREFAHKRITGGLYQLARHIEQEASSGDVRRFDRLPKDLVERASRITAVTVDGRDNPVAVAQALRARAARMPVKLTTRAQARQAATAASSAYQRFVAENGRDKDGRRVAPDAMRRLFAADQRASAAVRMRPSDVTDVSITSYSAGPVARHIAAMARATGHSLEHCEELYKRLGAEHEDALIYEESAAKLRLGWGIGQVISDSLLHRSLTRMPLLLAVQAHEAHNARSSSKLSVVTAKAPEAPAQPRDTASAALPPLVFDSRPRGPIGCGSASRPPPLPVPRTAEAAAHPVVTQPPPALRPVTAASVAAAAASPAGDDDRAVERPRDAAVLKAKRANGKAAHAHDHVAALERTPASAQGPPRPTPEEQRASYSAICSAEQPAENIPPKPEPAVRSALALERELLRKCADDGPELDAIEASHAPIGSQRFRLPLAKLPTRASAREVFLNFVHPTLVDEVRTSFGELEDVPRHAWRSSTLAHVPFTQPSCVGEFHLRSVRHVFTHLSASCDDHRDLGARRTTPTTGMHVLAHMELEICYVDTGKRGFWDLFEPEPQIEVQRLSVDLNVLVMAQCSTTAERRQEDLIVQANRTTLYNVSALSVATRNAVALSKHMVVSGGAGGVAATYEATQPTGTWRLCLIAIALCCVACLVGSGMCCAVRSSWPGCGPASSATGLPTPTPPSAIRSTASPPSQNERAVPCPHQSCLLATPSTASPQAKISSPPYTPPIWQTTCHYTRSVRAPSHRFRYREEIMEHARLLTLQVTLYNATSSSTSASSQRPCPASGMLTCLWKSGSVMETSRAQTCCAAATKPG